MKISLKTAVLVLFLAVGNSFFSPAKALAAVTYTLSPSTKTVDVNDSFDVSIVLDTGGQTVSGASAILTYDPTKLQVVDANAAQTGVQISGGTVFTTPLTNSVDTVNGKITLDYGLSAGTFSGYGTLGKITFKGAAQATSSPVSFVIGSSGATSSAVYASGSNVLGAANSGSYTVVIATSSPTPAVSASASALPRSGAVEDTIFLFMFGIFILSGGVVLAKVKAS